jgi:nucleoside-diphosphate-sugar epimerase
MHFVVTGGHGYIGRALVARALRAGHSLTVLGLEPWPDDSVSSIIWHLGEPVPAAAWREPVDAVLHLAHTWHDTAPEPSDINLVGSKELIDAARVMGVKRFVFASSLSSRADSCNRYGRVKFLLENILDRPGEVSARIGLVYGGPAGSLWGLFRRLVARLPVLPMIARRQSVQPIYLDDVAEGLLRLATVTSVPRRVVLATDPSLEFGQFLKEARWRLYRRRLILLELPVTPILALLGGLMWLGVPLMPVRERILGLVGLAVLPAQADAAWLGLQPLSLQQGLDCEIPHRPPRSIISRWMWR